MLKFYQFGLLVWKNWVIQRRKILVTLLEIGIPCTLAIILVFIRQDVKSTQFSNATSWPGFSADVLPNNISKTLWTEPWRVAWAPNNTETERIIKNVANKLKMNYQGFGYPAEDDMVRFLVGANGTAADFLCGIVFESLDPNHLIYKLRFPAIARGASKISLFGSESWQTEDMFPRFATVGPRYKRMASGGKPNYWQQGFLSIQEAMDRALLQHVDPSFNQSRISITFKRHPYPPYRDDAFVLVIQKQFTFIIMLSFVFIAQNVVKNIVHEKERKLKESMKMMGLANHLHWIAWFFHFFIMCTITVGLITAFVCVQFGPEGKVISNTDPSIVFVFLIAYAVSTLGFAFFVSTLFNKANTGAAAGGILFFITYIPWSFIQPRYHSLSLTGKLLCCLVNNVGMSLGGQVIGMFEGTGAGVQWSTIHRGASVDDDLSLLMVMLMLLVDAAIYMILTWYIEAVFPGEYGVALPWYFPLMRTYWCGHQIILLEVDSGQEYTSLNVDDSSDDYFESYPKDVEPGIQITNLRKVFKMGPRKVVAVKGTNLQFYQGQITALLGHNGAGKTTTIAMLTGFIPPTSGTAVLNGHDIRKDMDGVRKSLGLCPQHDVLFDELTVIEHLRFFCKLKGYPTPLIEDECLRMLEAVGLLDKQNTYSRFLSGGMKRTLSVAIALVGDSKVVILDEPTSGMDPNKRRKIWDILQKERPGRTMVLTTHHMDEADHLGDRIAIMSEGVVKCYGTSLFLKKKFGAGYHLVIVKQPLCNVQRLTNVIQRHVKNASLESNIGADLSYILPNESCSQFVPLFTELEDMKEHLDILSYGVSVTTMEEVFLRVGETADPELYERLRGGKTMCSITVSDSNSLTESQTDIPNVCGSTGSISTASEYNSGCLFYLQQFRALFYKRFLYTWRHRWVTLSQLAVPLIFTIAALAIIKTLPLEGNSPPLYMNISKYEENNVVMATDARPSQQAKDLAFNYKQYLDLFPKTRVTDINTLPFWLDYPDVEKYLVDLGIQSVSLYGAMDLIAVKFANSTLNPLNVNATAFFQNQGYHTSAISLNAIMNSVLRTTSVVNASNAKLSTINHPLPRTPQEEITDKLTDILVGFTISFNVVAGMSFLASSFILYLVRERATRSKHCQFVSGARASVFWLSTFVWDFINYMVPSLALFIVFAGFNIEAYTGDGRLALLLIVFVMYGWAILPFMYLSSFIFSVPSTGYVWMTMFNIFSGIATILTVEILGIPQLNTADLSRTLEWVFLTILPNFSFGQALETFYTNYEYLKLCDQPDVKKVCEFAPFITNFSFPCCEGYCEPTCFHYERNFMSWEAGGVGRMVVFLGIQGIVFFGILFAIESDLVHWCRFWILGRGSRRNLSTGRSGSPSHVADDSDVAAERHRIAWSSLDEPLVLRDVVKCYDGLVAVNGMNLGIAHGECFGLLGINGAGKTSTFKMLTGEESITRGDAFVCGYDVTKDSAKIRRHLGYCPQYDALVDHMTGRELLTMYARLRGVRDKVIVEVVNHLLYSLTLEVHADKLSQYYSGGNKRKLSTAIALVGEPNIVFLDEPTSGMDPVARRMVWDALSRFRAQGKTLVLTSHSMEECEALCTRMGIMVNGQLRCLGSQQHLKTKFGEGYTLMARVECGKNQHLNVEVLREYIQQTFPHSELKDIYQNMLLYHIPSEAVSWAGIFGCIEHVKEKLKIEDYSISQTTLEQVFINFARAQTPPREHKRSCCDRFFCCAKKDFNYYE